MVVFASDSNEEGRWYCLAGKLVEGGVVCREDMADIVVELILVLLVLLLSRWIRSSCLGDWIE